ncbi:type II toxin-antitoxin system RelE/ParE family toxin [Mucilaginibacter sp.]|uniref:type II toxin-antitoxin system RelE/ParE family toxin n=1 Tax=Mucilaginibacter sp. TaxID=1882438 RepID=UPI003D0EAC93
MTLIFAREAKETYASIQSQILDRWNRSVLAKFEQKTIKVLNLIAESPLIYPATTQNPNVRKGMINKNCSVFYEVKAEHIEVLFFWDNRQEPIL